MNRNILDRLAAGPVPGGGYIIELERRGYETAGAFTPHFVLDHPEVIRQPFPDSPMSETEFNWEHRHSDEPAVHA